MMRNTIYPENSHDNGKNKLNKLYIPPIEKCSCSRQPCYNLLEKNHTNKNHGIIEITVLQHHKIHATTRAGQNRDHLDQLSKSMNRGSLNRHNELNIRQNPLGFRGLRDSPSITLIDVMMIIASSVKGCIFRRSLWEKHREKLWKS